MFRSVCRVRVLAFNVETTAMTPTTRPASSPTILPGADPRAVIEFVAEHGIELRLADDASASAGEFAP